MSKKILRSWKKVYEADLPYVVSELKETIERPALIILTGELGTGKTTFSKNFLGAISSSSGQSQTSVQSPTYSIISETPTAVHADFYRLKEPSEIVQLELSLYLENKEYFLVEWGKNLQSVLEKEVDEKFHFYELILESNEGTKISSRNYVLKSLDRI